MTETTETTVHCDGCDKEWDDNCHYTESEFFRVRQFSEYTGISSKEKYHFCYDCLPDPVPQTKWFEEHEDWQYNEVEMSLKESGIVSYVHWVVYPVGWGPESDSEHEIYKGRSEITCDAPDDIYSLAVMVEEAYENQND